MSKKGSIWKIFESAPAAVLEIPKGDNVPCYSREATLNKTVMLC